MISTILGILLAVFKAVPILKQWWDQLLVMYIERQKAKLREEIRKAIIYALVEQDQRDIEKAVGNPNAGEPVRVPDSEIVDSLPGVKSK
jgi:hypothetical protein